MINKCGFTCIFFCILVTNLHLAILIFLLPGNRSLLSPAHGQDHKAATGKNPTAKNAVLLTFLLLRRRAPVSPVQALYKTAKHVGPYGIGGPRPFCLCAGTTIVDMVDAGSCSAPDITFSFSASSKYNTMLVIDLMIIFGSALVAYFGFIRFIRSRLVLLILLFVDTH